LWCFAAAVTLGAVSFGAWIVLLHPPITNADIYGYPNQVGIARSLYDIREAVAAYLDANGTLPANPESVRPILRLNHSRKDIVRCDQLLPFVTIVPANARTAPVGGLSDDGRFILVVYHNKGRRMRWDTATVVAEKGSQDLYFDEDLSRNFGPQLLRQLKEKAFVLP
jgi:hypothetical protein